MGRRQLSPQEAPEPNDVAVGCLDTGLEACRKSPRPRDFWITVIRDAVS